MDCVYQAVLLANLSRSAGRYTVLIGIGHWFQRWRINIGELSDERSDLCRATVICAALVEQYFHTDTNEYINCHANTYRHTNNHADIYSDSYTHRYSNRHTQRHANKHPNRHTDLYADRYADTHLYPNCDADTNVYANADKYSQHHYYD